MQVPSIPGKTWAAEAHSPGTTNVTAALLTRGCSSYLRVWVAEEVRVKWSLTDTDLKSLTKGAEREKARPASLSSAPFSSYLSPAAPSPRLPQPRGGRDSATPLPAPGPPGSPTPTPEARPARSPSVPSAAGKPQGSGEAPACTRRRKPGTPRSRDGWRGLSSERPGVPRGRPLAAGGPAAPRGVLGPVVPPRPGGSHRRASSVAGWLHGERLPVSRGRRAAAGRRSAGGSSGKAGKALLGADLGWLCRLWALCEFSVRAAEVQRARCGRGARGLIGTWPGPGCGPVAAGGLRYTLLCCALPRGRQAAALVRSYSEVVGDLFRVVT